MLEMETPEKVVAFATPRPHNDTKRFRLRAVSHEAEIYHRYFNSSFARKLSWVQIMLGAVVSMVQVTMSTTLQVKHGTTSSAFENISLVTWFSFFIHGSASLTTLWASKRSSYAKLHTGMALNIIGICTLCGILYLLRNIQHPTLVHVDLKELVHTVSTEFPRHINELENLTHSHPSAHIIGSNVLSSLVMLQIFVSIFMTFMTGRAICCGRSHLEGKFLEMEAVNKDKENTDAIVNFRMSRRDSSVSSSPNHSPPPYVPSPQFCGLHETKEL